MREPSIRGQADAIVSAVETKAEELKAEREALRELFQGLIEDGVLTEDEASQLSEDHWVFNEAFDEAWADGELTTEEIRENRPHRGKLRKAARLGALLDDGGIDQEEYDSLDDDHPLKQIDVLRVPRRWDHHHRRATRDSRGQQGRQRRLTSSGNAGQTPNSQGWGSCL